MVYLIDYENTRRLPDIDFFRKKDKIIIFIGQQQKTMQLEDVQMLLRKKKRIKFVQIEGSSKNNLDFHLVWYLGSICNKKGKYAIISNDKDYDSLIKHLNSKNHKVSRIPLNNRNENRHIQSETNKNKPNSEFETFIVAFEKRPVHNRPKKLNSLQNFVSQLLPKEKRGNKTLVDEIIQVMINRKILSVENQKIKY